ncbi:hypothetical protein BK742_21840 [Bacillus thuringiensis serovar pingluonsis]|uniref:Uncharacterized protein n=2 Tax=Bacillus TaxID=1386 RepID=A0A243B6G0_BACTU|nr:hypothetical protein BK742_21840 [Bacillus thuringiensis serovar pingluonsis]
MLLIMILKAVEIMGLSSMKGMDNLEYTIKNNGNLSNRYYIVNLYFYKNNGYQEPKETLELGNQDTDKNEWMHIEIYPDKVFMRINTFGGRKHSKKIDMNRDLTNEALILEAIGIFTNYWG